MFFKKKKSAVAAGPTSETIKRLFPLGPWQVDNQLEQELRALCAVKPMMERLSSAAAEKSPCNFRVLVQELSSEKSSDSDRLEAKDVFALMRERHQTTDDLYTFIDSMSLVEITDCPPSILEPEHMLMLRAVPHHTTALLLISAFTKLGLNAINRSMVRKFPEINFPPDGYVTWSANVQDQTVQITGYINHDV